MNCLFLIGAIIAALFASGHCALWERTMECHSVCSVLFSKASDINDMKITALPGNTCLPGAYKLKNDFGFVYVKITGKCGGKFQISRKTGGTTKAPKYTLPPGPTKTAIMECKIQKDSDRYAFCLILNANPTYVNKMKIKALAGNTCPSGAYELKADYGFVFIKITGACGGNFEITFSGKRVITTKAPQYTLPPGTAKPATGNCGIKTAGTGFRIVGGQLARECQYPWMVRIMSSSSRGTSLCGGSIIDKYHILTAAHCVSTDNYPRVSVTSPYRIRILTGSNTKHKQVSRSVSRVFVHQSYGSLNNDIAVVRLSQAIRFDTCHSPVCLTNDQRITEGRSCRVMGWGRVNPYSYQIPNVMKWIEDPMDSSFNCQSKYKSPYKQTVVCGKATSFCSGDSGGPFVCLGAGNKYYQYGIVSAHLKVSLCKGSGKYTFVPYYSTWIDRMRKQL